MLSTSQRFLLASWSMSGNLSPRLTAGFAFTGWRRAPVGVAADPPDASDIGAFLRQAGFGPAAADTADVRDEIGRTPTDALLSIDMLFGAALGAESLASHSLCFRRTSASSHSPACRRRAAA